jgi:uncharacterized protein (DUF486 family)
MRAALLLILSNIFMTFAWYGHLKWFPQTDESGRNLFPFKIIVISWGIAFFEYCFQVPGNRIGKIAEHLSLGQLKIMQEVITLAVFTAFTLFYMREQLNWRYGGACVLMIGAVALVFSGKQ